MQLSLRPELSTTKNTRIVKFVKNHRFRISAPELRGADGPAPVSPGHHRQALDHERRVRGHPDANHLGLRVLIARAEIRTRDQLIFICLLRPLDSAAPPNSRSLDCLQWGSL